MNKMELMRAAADMISACVAWNQTKQANDAARKRADAAKATLLEASGRMYAEQSRFPDGDQAAHDKAFNDVQSAHATIASAEAEASEFGARESGARWAFEASVEQLKAVLGYKAAQ